MLSTPYQGGIVDTRVQFQQAWSNPTTTRYMHPTIHALRMSVGGSKGTFILKERKGRLSLSLATQILTLVFAFLEYARKDRKLKLQAKISELVIMVM